MFQFLQTALVWFATLVGIQGYPRYHPFFNRTIINNTESEIPCTSPNSSVRELEGPLFFPDQWRRSERRGSVSSVGVNLVAFEENTLEAVWVETKVDFVKDITFRLDQRRCLIKEALPDLASPKLSDEKLTNLLNFFDVILEDLAEKRKKIAQLLKPGGEVHLDTLTRYQKALQHIDLCREDIEKLQKEKRRAPHLQIKVRGYEDLYQDGV